LEQLQIQLEQLKEQTNTKRYSELSQVSDVTSEDELALFQS